MEKSLGITILIVAGVLFLVLAAQPLETGNQMKRFASYDELSSFLNERTESQGYGGIMTSEARGLTGVAPVSAPGAADTMVKSNDYSTTNIQVEGVDEPDVVKNDGKYIYTASSGTVTIVDAYPASGMKEVSNINLSGTVSNMFINGDKLVVFGNNYGHWGGPYVIAETAVKAGADVSIMPPRYYSTPSAFIHVYDLTDRANPVLVKNVTIEGSYVDARMIGDYVYAIAQQPVRMLDSGPMLPVLSVDSRQSTIEAGDISYSDQYDTSFTYNFIIALNTQNMAEEPTKKVFLLGYSEDMYVSEGNIYTVYTKYLSQTEQNSRMVEAIIPMLPAHLQVEANRIWNDRNTTTNEKTYEIGRLIQDYVESLGPEAGASFMQSLEQKMQTVATEMQKDMVRTVIHKIAVSGPSIEYKVSGEVPGRVLNQFSMDEFNGNFRIATTTGDSWDQTSVNNMYVLDQNLGTIGRLEDLAQGEQIYSVRFMGERAYMVTFHRTDPLFVIDLSNPADPKVLGELKMPGFSDYLHPVDKDHLIGLGQMTDDDGRATGQVKLSLFDVSDVANPKETSSYLIGEQGGWAYSEALNDHKAFLFSQPKGILSIPVSINNWHTDRYFQGAYVFSFSIENGFSLKGKVTHEVVNASAEEQYYDYGTAVRRSLYMDDVLYTVSDGMVKASNLADLSEISHVTFDTTHYGYPVVY